MSLILRT